MSYETSWLEIQRLALEKDYPTFKDDWMWFKPSSRFPTSLHPDFLVTCKLCDVRFRYTPETEKRCRCWSCGRFLKEPARWERM